MKKQSKAQNNTFIIDPRFIKTQSIMPPEPNGMVPFLSIASIDFEGDLSLIKEILNRIESMAHCENGYKFSERAQLAAGWWFYDIYFSSELVQSFLQLILPPNFPRNKGAAASKIINIFQKRLKQSGSDARVKMYGDIPAGAGLWSFMLR